MRWRNGLQKLLRDIEEEFAKKASVPIEAKAPKGAQAQSNNTGAPEGEEHSDSSSSSEEDEEWSPCEACVTACHIVSRSRDLGILAAPFRFASIRSTSTVFCSKKYVVAA